MAGKAIKWFKFLNAISVFFFFFPHPYIVFSFGLRGYVIKEVVETKKLNGLGLC